MRDILFIPFSVKVLNRIEREWTDEEKIQPHIKVPNFLAPEVLRGNFKVDLLFMIELRLIYAEDSIITDRRSWLKIGLVIL